MKKGELKIGKWHFKFGIIPLYYRTDGFLFHFGIFKMLKHPDEGMIITREHYKGFWFRKEFSPQGFEINF